MEIDGYSWQAERHLSSQRKWEEAAEDEFSRFDSVMSARILIVDDSPVVRQRLAMLLQQHDDWQVCGEAVNGFEAIEKATQLKPDLIVMDFLMPGMNGLQAARKIGSEVPSIPILMFTMHMSKQLIEEAKNAGVQGAVAKTNVGGMLEGVESLLRHQPYFSSH